MKKLLTLILLMQFQILFAGTPPLLVASPSVPNITDGHANHPVENQEFGLWQVSFCSPNNLETDLIITGNDILFFGHSYSIINPGICQFDSYNLETQVNGLAAGIYNLSYYSIPSADDFPPVVADYPQYLVEQSQFTVVPPRLMVSPSSADSIVRETLPLEGQAFRLWDFLPHWSCSGVSSTQVNYSTNNKIDVLVLQTSGVCVDPIPPINFPVADIQALEAGDYQIDYYIIPEGNTFPPLVTDYPSYFIESKTFSVLQAHNIDAISIQNLIGLFSIILLMGVFWMRNKI